MPLPDALGEVADAALGAGKAAGILLLDPANLPLVRELGYPSSRWGRTGAPSPPDWDRASGHCVNADVVDRTGYGDVAIELNGGSPGMRRNCPVVALTTHAVS